MKITITIEMDERELEMTKEEEVEKVDGEYRNVSIYARFFNGSCPAWTKNPDMNMMYLMTQRQYATDMLKLKGHLFLNEVYDMLGMTRTKEGQVVGWVYDPDNPIGDNYVDFGIFEDYNQDFVNGYETTALLDFNVDGNILDRI